MNNILPDTPWHIGYAKKKESDPRRHKSRCVYINEGYCKLLGCKCGGSAHCTSYSEKNESYFLNEVRNSRNIYVSQEVRDFVQDRGNESRSGFVKDIKKCLVCNQDINWYKPLSYMAKKCPCCKLLFINEDVYYTYMADINRNSADSLLCLVGIKTSRKINKSSTDMKEKKLVKENTKPLDAVIKKVEPKGKKNTDRNKKLVENNTLGNDPRFKDIFASIRDK